MSSRILFVAALGAFFVSSACASSPTDTDACSDGDPSCDLSAEETAARAHPFDVGMNEWLGEIPSFEKFRSLSGATDPRLCHVYTYWNVARADAPGGGDTHTRAGLLDWFSKIAGHCDEPLVTFQGAQQHGVVEPAPSVAQMEGAFVDFLAMTNPGGPLAAWKGKLSFTPWNEPNNGAGSGDGLGEAIPAETAARYYLAMRRHCAPSDGCTVAAGDLASNGGMADDFEWNCANDGAAMTASHCNPSPMSGSGTPSYLDRYKHVIDDESSKYGLPSNFRPEVFAYHPWHDVNSYIESKTACSDYDHCVTRKLLRSLGGSWGGVEIWDDEIGIGLQTSPAPSEKTQACGAAFLVRLTDLSPRITRVYYMRFSGGNGPLFDGGAIRPAGDVLAHRSPNFGGGACPNTGIVLASYQNPVIPIADRPPGVSSGPATEGCPDPTGMKTKSGKYYVYCTSYTFPYSRFDGYPIYESPSLGASWKRVGSIIPDSGPGRSSWPKWVRDSGGKRFGLFWAPDVHELPNGKFSALYAAPCGANGQCVGMAWSDRPDGGFTHAQTPFVSSSNNGIGGGSTYDPNLLVTPGGDLYLYWVVAGHGIFGAQVGAQSDGKLSFVSSPRKMSDWGGAGGEGPYVIEHEGAYYLFYSTAKSGHLVYDYETHVRRASSPLGPFSEEGPVVLHKGDAADGHDVSSTEFVATGGNSVIQDAVDGVDFIVYHAIEVGPKKECPAADPEDGKAVEKTDWNPYCRLQSERQAMIDPITWRPDGAGGQWPTVNGGSPSIHRTLLP